MRFYRRGRLRYLFLRTLIRLHCLHCPYEHHDNCYADWCECGYQRGVSREVVVR